MEKNNIRRFYPVTCGYIQNKYFIGDDDMNLKIDKYQNGKEIFVTVAGEIDAYTAPELGEELFPLVKKSKTIIVNLRDVSYLDSTGLSVFVSLFKQLMNNNGELKLIGLSERFIKLFEITG